MSPGENLRGLFRNVVGVFLTEPRLHASDHASVRKAKACVANQECRWTRHLFHFGSEECLLGKFSASILADGGDFPLVSGVCLHMQRPAIADEPSEIRGTSSLWEYSVVGCAFMQRRIIFPLFMLPLWAYILFMNSWEPTWLTSCVYTCKRRKLFHLPTTVAWLQNTPDVWTVWPAGYDWWLSE